MVSPNPITPFGTLRKLDLRTLWPKEAASFTPWLRNNLNLLGDAVGMDLIFEDQEAADDVCQEHETACCETCRSQATRGGTLPMLLWGRWRLYQPSM